MKNEYVIVDIETTGLSKHIHKITEIAALKIENFQVVKRFETLVNPETHIPSFITSLTGISNSMVKDAPTINEALPKFTNFISNSPFVAHSASFDYGFLNYNSQLFLSQELKNPKICTIKLSRRLVPELRSHKLSCLCEYFKIKNNSAHRAMSDVEATHQLFNNLLERMKKIGIENKEQVISFQNSKIRKE